MGVVCTLGVAEPVAVGVPVETGVPVPVGIGEPVEETVGVGDGVKVGVEHKVKSIVQEAPSEGQQYCFAPQLQIVPTLLRLEQLISSGAVSVIPAQLLSVSPCPATGQASAAGQELPDAFCWKSCCCLTKATPATTLSAKNRTITRAMIIPFAPPFFDLELVTISNEEFV